MSTANDDFPDTNDTNMPSTPENTSNSLESTRATTTKHILRVRTRPVSESADRQVQLAFLQQFHRFDEWEKDKHHAHLSVLSRLRQSLDHLLPRLLAARDFAGVAQVLALLYYRFTLNPVLCAQTSLEVLRRQPQSYTNKMQLMQFYHMAAQNDRLDKLYILKELFLFHLTNGEFYEAYRLYKEDIHAIGIQHDARILGNFGILCYWLIFIESYEMRDAFAATDITNDESPHLQAYAYKTPIGVHILYQDASSSLRRVISLCPQSIHYLEYFVHLLVLTGRIEEACDHLEHTYLMTPHNPHTARMLVQFLELYYPDCTSDQCEIYLQWFKQDPQSSFAFQKLLDFESSGVLGRKSLFTAIMHGLDTLGSQAYMSKMSEQLSDNMTLRLWKELVDIYNVWVEDDVSDTLNNFLTEITSTRHWWLRIFGSTPSTSHQIVALAKLANTEHLDTVLYKAGALIRLFPIRLTKDLLLMKVIANVMESEGHLLKECHVQLIKSLNLNQERNIENAVGTQEKPQKNNLGSEVIFQRMPTILSRRNVIINDTKYAKLPRVSITKDTISESKSCSNNNDTSNIATAVSGQQDRHPSIDYGNIHAVNQTLGQPPSDPFNPIPIDYTVLSKLEKHLGPTISNDKPSIPSVFICPPVYVEIIEEISYTTYRSPLKIRDIRCAVQERMQALMPSQISTSLILPTEEEVKIVAQFFYDQWTTQEVNFGHRGMLWRFDIAFVQFLLEFHHHYKNFSLVDRHDLNLLLSMAQDYLRDHVVASHRLFPSFETLDIALKRKLPTLARRRRQVLRKFYKAVDAIVGQHDFQKLRFLTTEDLSQPSWSVYKEQYKHSKHVMLLNYDDFIHIAERALMKFCHTKLCSLWPRYLKFLRDPSCRGTSRDPKKVLSIAKYKFRSQHRGVTLLDIHALLYLEHFEQKYGLRFDLESYNNTE